MTWTRETIRSELRQLLQQQVQSGADITEASHLVGDLGLDSLGMMEMLADIEDKFKLHIPDEALRDIETVGNVLTAIETRLQAEGRLAG
jgi:acyl carrier protein